EADGSGFVGVGFPRPIGETVDGDSQQLTTSFNPSEDWLTDVLETTQNWQLLSNTNFIHDDEAK
ncbi:MAG: hypothetical protein ACLFT0_12110, partial [Spirulinaceae cyanobacterium]